MPVGSASLLLLGKMRYGSASCRPRYTVGNSVVVPDLPHAPVDSNEEENHATKQESTTETEVSRDQKEQGGESSLNKEHIKERIGGKEPR